MVNAYEFHLGLSPLPVTVTTRIITFLVGDPYKPSFATVTGRGDNPSFTTFFRAPSEPHQFLAMTFPHLFAVTFS